MPCGPPGQQFTVDFNHVCLMGEGCFQDAPQPSVLLSRIGHDEVWHWWIDDHPYVSRVVELQDLREVGSVKIMTRTVAPASEKKNLANPLYKYHSMNMMINFNGKYISPIYPNIAMESHPTILKMYISCIYFLLKQWWWILPAMIAIPSTVDIQDAELLALEEELKALDAEANWVQPDEEKKGFFPKLMANLESWKVGFNFFVFFLPIFGTSIWIEWQNVGLVRDFLLK